MDEEEQELEESSYFFDSYAIIEMIDGNLLYKKYESENITITLFNLAEIYWSVLLKGNEEDANKVFERFRPSVANIDDETLREAVKFRKQYKKQDLSYTDCIGYIYAKRHNMKFLTGDKEFEKLDNVEFVK